MSRAALSPLWSRRFWLLTSAALLALGATLSLGVWQLSRAAQKLALHSVIEQRMALPPIDAATLAAAPEPGALMHRRASLQGRWLPQHAVFLDNRQMRGLPGFFVLTPFQLEGSGAVLLVQRGWVQRNFVDRARLPAVATPAGVLVLQGRIAPPPSKLYEFQGAKGGAIRQNLDLAEFQTETGLALLPVSLLQTTGPADEGLLRDWPEPSLGNEKHYGYAFQWFGLSALIVILYVWFQIVRRRPS
ncbi:MAG: SURF1 family protein [Burkholderiaceae bacterium]|nr:SURF1 family protein [Burkholderiaceae bacterium]MDO9088950.1 SURF1 family protein [Burkholderiaceae bacterium]MDP1968545.1 SURF1 family protein [Burkholderiaceae bacterium]